VASTACAAIAQLNCGGDDNVLPGESATAAQRPQLDVVHL
jgi:hypothetical protein